MTINVFGSLYWSIHHVTMSYDKFLHPYLSSFYTTVVAYVQLVTFRPGNWDKEIKEENHYVLQAPKTSKKNIFSTMHFISLRFKEN